MRSTILGGLAAVLLLATGVVPALAKEGVEARLDAPIGMGTPGGTELLVGMTVTAPDGDTTHPVEGTPMYLRLTGRDGSSTRASGAAEGKPGHYAFRIVVPAGGARAVEVGIHGTSDLAVMVVGDALVFGGITAKTAQEAPPVAPALTPFPRASVAAVAPAPAAPAVEPAPVGAPAAGPAPAPAEPGGPTAVLVVGLVMLAAAAGLGALLAVRRLRRPRPAAVADRAPGA